MASTFKEWRLGDAPPTGYRLVRERHELPPSRDLVIKLLTDILAKNVQKVVVEVRKPIEVLRLAKEVEVGPLIEDVPAGDLYGMVRNSPISDVVFDPTAPILQRLMEVFERIRGAGLEPVGCLGGDSKTVTAWFGYTKTDLTAIMGIPLVFHHDIPDDVLTIACRLTGEPEGVDQSFKFTLDLPEVTK